MTTSLIGQRTPTIQNGTFTKASARQNPDLFFALKGGMNRFGIVTSAELTTHPQPAQIYVSTYLGYVPFSGLITAPVPIPPLTIVAPKKKQGGIAIYSHNQIPALLNATARFSSENKDPRASIITTLEGSPTGATALVLFFFDGPEKPSSFNLFDPITPLVSTVRPQSFLSFISGIPSSLTEIRNPRGGFITMSTSQISRRFLEAVYTEVQVGISRLTSGCLTLFIHFPKFTLFVMCTLCGRADLGEPLVTKLVLSCYAGHQRRNASPRGHSSQLRHRTLHPVRTARHGKRIPASCLSSSGRNLLPFLYVHLFPHPNLPKQYGSCMNSS